MIDSVRSSKNIFSPLLDLFVVSPQSSFLYKSNSRSNTLYHGGHGGRYEKTVKLTAEETFNSSLGIPQSLIILCSFTTRNLSKKLIDQIFFIRFLVVLKNIFRNFSCIPQVRS